MDVRFLKKDVERLYTDPTYSGSFCDAVVRSFRKRVMAIVNAQDERVFYQMKSLHYEKLKGNRSHQSSMRLNDQWRLILEVEGKAPKKTVVVIDIEDYH
jgi:proteic killer suppression protein